MRVMVMVKATKNSEAGVMPSEKLLADMGKYNEELVKAGIMLAGEGLQPSSTGRRVKFSSSKRTIVDGPFAETKELVAGFWLWQVKSMEEAVEWARRCPAPMPGEEGELEIRPVYELDDFGAAATPEVLARHERIRAELSQRRGSPPTKIDIEASVQAPLARVWGAWNAPDAIKEWNAASEDWHTTSASVDLRVGGSFSSRMEAKDGSAGFDFTGTYTRVEPRHLIEYVMSDGREVRNEFVAQGDIVKVRVSFDAETENPVELQRQGWQAILDNFARYVERHSRSA
jgi:uncharacterized protein YndB with AHSA1/START domain